MWYHRRSMPLYLVKWFYEWISKSLEIYNWERILGCDIQETHMCTHMKKIPFNILLCFLIFVDLCFKKKKTKHLSGKDRNGFMMLWLEPGSCSTKLFLHAEKWQDNLFFHKQVTTNMFFIHILRNRRIKRSDSTQPKHHSFRISL